MARRFLSLKNLVNLRFQGWKHNQAIRLILFVMIALLFYFSISDRLISETYDIQLGEVSEKEIIAPRPIENVEAFERAKEEAARSVGDVYPVVSMRNSELLRNILDKIERVNADPQLTTNQKVDVYRHYFATEYEYFFEKVIQNSSRNESLSEEMRKRVMDQQYRIPEEIFFKFPRLTQADLDSMKPVALGIVNKLMSDAIDDVEVPRAQVAELVNASDLNKSLSREIVQELVRYVITPNKFYDEEATQKAREAAQESVQPIFYNKGDVIVKQGEKISEEIYQLLETHGLLKDKEDYWPEVGLLFLVVILVFILFMFIRQSDLSIKTNNIPLVMLTLIYALNIIGMKIVSLGQNPDFPHIGYLAPVALGSMMIAILLDVRLAYVSSVLFSILASIIFNVHHQDIIFDFRFGFYAIVVCFVSIFAIHRASQRLTILKAGFLISIFAVMSILSIILLTRQYEMKEMLFSLSFAFAGGILTAVLVMGLLPFFEVLFGILSPLKLVELSNPNHPLLRKLLTETPGTYHHSVMVGNLAETAAEAIGANGLLCRVGSFYHDIGKTKRPSYFIENQVNGENPHDHIDPDLSKSIIIAHARDGVEMLKEYNIPKQICDIAEQHHGTTLLTYFYNKALKLQEEGKGPKEPIKEEDYRYPGPKAQTKEAAIVGIADCIEAAVRSLKNPTMEQINQMVDKIIKNRMDDGQFNECDLTLKELNTIGKSIKESLLGIFHSRIEYPELPNKGEDKGNHH